MDDPIQIDFAIIQRWEATCIRLGASHREVLWLLAEFVRTPSRRALFETANAARRAEGRCSALHADQARQLVAELEDAGGRIDPPPRRRQWD